MWCKRCQSVKASTTRVSLRDGSSLNLDLLELSGYPFPMNTKSHVNRSQGHPRFARRVGSVKAKPVTRLECFAKTSTGSFRERKHHDSATGPEDIRCRGRSLGTRFDEILPDSERGDQKSVLLGSPISRCDHQGRMQNRLSARSSGTLESSRSSGGSDSELSHVRSIPTNHGRGRTNSEKH